MKKGFVYLIGAGPGDPELITEKAIVAIKSADCIIYDFLANSKLIEELDCEKIYVGKKGSKHTLKQEDINKLIVEKAIEGKTVVRLKGGDSFIFGRGGEEAEEIIEAGVEFAVIPGISSFYSAPAYAGIPLTHRDYANSFEVITGHRRDDASEFEDINFPEYNDQKSFVFLMGMKNLAYISDKLIREKGFPKETPVGIIQWGTFPKQRVVKGNLKNIADKAKREGIGAPAIIVIGKVVSLRDKLRWFDNMPLFGKKIVVTRTRTQASNLTRKLSHLGADVIEFPTIEIKPKLEQSDLRNAINNLDQYEWIIFTSQNAVNIFFTELKNAGLDSRSLSKNRIAVIGIASGKEVEKYFITPDLIPPKYVAESLLEELVKEGVSGKNILLPCASEARPALKEGLEYAGAIVERIHIYDTVTPENISEETLADVKGADLVTFTSSSTVNNFFKIIDSTKSKIACIGPITAETAKKYDIIPDMIADEYTIDGLVEAVLNYYK